MLTNIVKYLLIMSSSLRLLNTQTFFRFIHQPRNIGRSTVESRRKDLIIWITYSYTASLLRLFHCKCSILILYFLSFTIKYQLIWTLMNLYILYAFTSARYCIKTKSFYWLIWWYYLIFWMILIWTKLQLLTKRWWLLKLHIQWTDGGCLVTIIHLKLHFTCGASMEAIRVPIGLIVIWGIYQMMSWRALLQFIWWTIVATSWLAHRSTRIIDIMAHPCLCSPSFIGIDWFLCSLNILWIYLIFSFLARFHIFGRPRRTR